MHRLSEPVGVPLCCTWPCVVMGQQQEEDEEGDGGLILPSECLDTH